MRSGRGVSITEARGGDDAVLIERGDASASTETQQWRWICDPGQPAAIDRTEPRAAQP